MKPAPQDEMFPDDIESDGGNSGNLLMDLAANEKDIHADFYNDFGDIFDEDDL